jgi:putative SOS response-associated peptidase YedK
MAVSWKSMLERYVLPDQLAAEREFMPARCWWQFSARYNVAPPQYVPAIRIHDGQSEGMMMRWGLIPGWAEGKPGDPNISVDIDEIDDSKTYRTPWLESQRCILPVAGFYTWRLNRHRYRQPYFAQVNNRSVFGIAALWDRSESGGGDVTESCAVVCVAANELLARVLTPPARMPAVLRRRDYDAWLKGTPVQAKAALEPYNAGWMQAHAVSPRINAITADDPDLIRPV